MAQNVTLWGASYNNVPSVEIPKTGGGKASFDDTTDANATASDIMQGKTAYVNGTKLTGTASGGGSTYVYVTTWTNSSNTATSHTFSSLNGTPKYAMLRCTSTLSRSSSQTYYYISDIVWGGINARGNYFARSTGAVTNVANDGGYSVSTGTNSITFTSNGGRGTTPGSFYNGTYELTYIY